MNRNLGIRTGVKVTSQSEPIPGRADMAQNNAGGFGWQVDKWQQLMRFLILGTQGGTYYVGEHKLSKDNIDSVVECIKEEGRRVVETVVNVSLVGRAPKNDYALYVLAACTSPDIADAGTRKAAFEALPKVARIGTHLFQFCTYVEQWRGWGRGLKNAVGDWYGRPVEKLAYQLVKYRQREGWSHRDLLRLSHPYPGEDASRRALYAWATDSMFTIPVETELLLSSGLVPEELLDLFVVQGVELKGKITVVPFADSWRVDSVEDGKTHTYYIARGYEYLTVSKRAEGSKWEDLPELVLAFEEAQKASSVKEIVSLIKQYNLPRECIPTNFLTEKAVWEALLTAGEGMPMTALIRNLGNLSKCGVLVDGDFATIRTVADRIDNEELLKAARVHPFTILTALTTYQQGHGMRSDSMWSVVGDIVDALDSAFYKAFSNVEPTNKRYLLGLDISGSMSDGEINGVPGMTPRVGACAMSMITYRTEPNTSIMAFQTQFVPMNITRTQKLKDVVDYTEELPMGGTDCALPMTHALKQYRQNNNIVYDIFIIYTDNETWAGSIHPKQALDQYRREVNKDAKVIVVGMTSGGFTIADPMDAGMLDMVGFDASGPEIISNFALGVF